jgi:cytoskeleton protein RodZ
VPDIGTTLRETRMRRRIDIVEVESHTKIRAKYLRALENEEWDLLPGPTFVRTFLRTYGDYLGLDSKMLVEEYKQRFERPGPHDLLPFSPRAAGRRQRRPPPVVPPFVIVAICVVLLLGALYALGQLGGGDGGSDAEVDATATPSATATASGSSTSKAKKSSRKKKAAAPTRVRLRIVPTGTVNVCLVSGVSGKVLIKSENLSEGSTTRTYSAKRLKVTFGNGNARMRIGGKSYDVPDTQDGIGYDLRPGHKPMVLSAAARPDCVS